VNRILEEKAVPSSPLAGVRVLDLTNVLAGPMATYHLALLGAEVIKLERPGSGDLARVLGADLELSMAGMGASFLSQNGGKKSLTLNLQTPRGVEILKGLAQTADVVCESFRPGVMERLGIGPDDLRAQTPSLIYCRLSGFGQTGPLRDRAAYDQIIQGMAGIMSITGDQATTPLRAGPPVSDAVAGLNAAIAILAALLKRKNTGAGETIDVSMLDCSISLLAWVAGNYLIADVAPIAMGNDNFTASPSGTFRTGNGDLNIAANQETQFIALARVIGRLELIEDPRFASREARKHNRASLRAEIESALASKTAVEWDRALNDAGVPAGLVLTVPEALQHPHVKERGIVHTFDGVGATKRAIRVLKAGFKFESSELSPKNPPPALGEHTEFVLAGLGYTTDDIRDLRASGVV
jgi:CoA:oxalate CoA-transferase